MSRGAIDSRSVARIDLNFSTEALVHASLASEGGWRRVHKEPRTWQMSLAVNPGRDPSEAISHPSVHSFKSPLLSSPLLESRAAKLDSIAAMPHMVVDISLGLNFEALDIDLCLIMLMKDVPGWRARVARLYTTMLI